MIKESAVFNSRAVVQNGSTKNYLGGFQGSQDNKHTQSMNSGGKFDYGAFMQSNKQQASQSYNMGSILKAIGQNESNNNYGAVGQMMQSGAHRGTAARGRYQMMDKTLAGLGFKGDTNSFMKDQKLQDAYAQKLFQQNARSLGIKDINNMSAKEAQLSFGAWYSGAGAMKNYQRNANSARFSRAQTGTGSNFPSIKKYMNKGMNTLNNQRSNMLKLSSVMENLRDYLSGPGIISRVPKLHKEVTTNFKNQKEFKNISFEEKQLYINKFKEEVNKDSFNNGLKLVGALSLVPVISGASNYKNLGTFKPNPKSYFPAAIVGATSILMHRYNKNLALNETDQRILNEIKGFLAKE